MSRLLFHCYYRLVGHETVPCDDILEWARAFESVERHVGETTLNGVRVSTVFLGIAMPEWDPAMPWRRRAMLFETMVFGGALDQREWRYETWHEAEAGHAAVVAWAQREIDHPRRSSILHPLVQLDQQLRKLGSESESTTKEGDHGH